MRDDQSPTVDTVQKKEKPNAAADNVQLKLKLYMVQKIFQGRIMGKHEQLTYYKHHMHCNS